VLSREVGRRMVRRGQGKIIFTASLLSFQGGINVPGYTAAKSGLVGLTRALANEWAGKGVNVNAIAPGYIETDNTEARAPTRYATSPSSNASRLVAGAVLMTSPARWSSWPRIRRTMSAAP